MMMRLRNYDILRVLDRDKGGGAGVGKYIARIFKRLWSPGIDSKEIIPPAYVAWRAGTITLFLLGP